MVTDVTDAKTQDGRHLMVAAAIVRHGRLAMLGADACSV